MTWNIHGAVGRNPRFDLERVVALVQRHRPDIVALQEIDSRRAREAHVDEPFKILQESLGNHGIGAKTVTTADGEYGQALISRWPMANTEIHDLSFPEREPRRAICSDIQTPAGPLRVIATHLGPELPRAPQPGRRPAEDAGQPAHDHGGAGRLQRLAVGGLGPSQPGKGAAGLHEPSHLPSRCPLFHLDRVYLWPRAALVASHTDPEARTISDHLPVIGDIRVGAR